MECGHLDRVCGKNGFQSSNFPALTEMSARLECGECGDTSSVWLCLTCGALNCGRYIKAHGLMHKVQWLYCTVLQSQRSLHVKHKLKKHRTEFVSIQSTNIFIIIMSYLKCHCIKTLFTLL